MEVGGIRILTLSLRMASQPRKYETWELIPDIPEPVESAPETNSDEDFIQNNADLLANVYEDETLSSNYLNKRDSDC